MAGLSADLGPRGPNSSEKLRAISWSLLLLICAVAAYGIVVLYSAADGHMQPWAAAQTMRFAIALAPLLGAALVDIRHWFRIAYWLYAVSLLLVVAVDLRGFVGMGAQRWIDLGIIQLQPSQLMNDRVDPRSGALFPRPRR